MLSFKQYLNESYLESGRQELHHFTDHLGLLNILKSGKLGTQYTSELPSLSHLKGKDKPVSLTRNKNLNFQNHPVRLSFSGESIKSRHKIKPYVDNFMRVNRPHERRTEYEERSHSSIDVRKTKPRIEVKKEYLDDINKRIDTHINNYKKYKSLYKETNDPNFKFDAQKHSGHFNLSPEKVQQQLDKNPNWQPKGMRERLFNSMHNSRKQIKDLHLIKKNIHGTMD